MKGVYEAVDAAAQYDDITEDEKEAAFKELDRLYALEKRNAILEAAVAFHGFDEVPEGGIFRVIELRRADGKTNNGQKINFDRYKNNGDYTGWRYPVGDLSE